MEEPIEQARRLAADDPTGWFDRLYVAAERGEAVVPWDRGGPHPLLEEWTREHNVRGGGRRALVVGCGFGSDAEHLAAIGFATTAFDLSPTAVRGAQARFPNSPVDYRAANLLEAPAQWRRAFDLVLESLTVQSLPDPPRREAIARVADLVAPGGTLLVIATARDGPPPTPPWPLTREEIDAFAADGGLETIRAEHLRDPAGEVPPRWRAELRRPG